MWNNNTPRGAVAVTPGATQLGLVGLYVGGAGNVQVVDALGVTTTFTGVATGETISLQIAQVLSGGTTATNLVGYLP